MTRLDVVAPPSRQVCQPPTHQAEDLTQGGQQAWIEFRGKFYVLRITRQGKLILTK